MNRQRIFSDLSEEIAGHLAEKTEELLAKFGYERGISVLR
jgi:hypothetical protein